VIEDKVERLVNIKKDVLKELENLRSNRLIKSSLEAEVALFVTDESATGMMADMGPELTRFFQVSKITLSPVKTDEMRTYDNSSVVIQKTGGKKCIRCWNYYDTIGSDPNHPELCGRCTNIINTTKQAR
jgi:isoleucyl-tRNA synthetase